MSKRISSTLAALVKLATRPTKPYRRRITRALVGEKMAQTVAMDVNGVEISFHSTTARSLHDVLKQGMGEPETIAWIRGLEPGALWDIGANIGLYGLYAVALGHRVIAFEPSAATFSALCKNIEINGMSDRASAFCVALSDRTELGALWMERNDAGHSMHSIEREGRHKIRQAIPVFAADEFQRTMGLEPPDYLKIDVDGIDDKVLQGAISFGSLKSVLIEAETEQARAAIAKILAPYGFKLNESLSAGAARNIVYDRIPLNGD